MIKHRLRVKGKMNEGLLLALDTAILARNNRNKNLIYWTIICFPSFEMKKEWTNSERFFPNPEVNSSCFVLLFQTVTEYPLLPGLRFPFGQQLSCFWAISQQCRLLCHNHQLTHLSAWAAECLSNTLMAHAHSSVCKLQSYTCILNCLFWRKGEECWGKSKSFWVAFITCSIKATFPKRHLSLQALSTLKFKDLICRWQNSNT